MLLTMLDISIEESQTAVLETVDSFSSYLLPKVIEHIDPKAVKGDLRKKGPTSSSVHKFAKNKKTAYAFRGTGALTRRKITKLKESTNPKEQEYSKCFVRFFKAVAESIRDACGNGDLNIAHSYRMELHSTLNPEIQEGMHPDASKKVLVDYAAGVLGRVTRVYLVIVQSKDGGQFMKDYWVDEGRSFEFPITKETLEYLRKDYGEDAAQLVERQFISIMKEMNVKAGDQDDHTLNVRMHTTLPVAIGNDDLRMSGYVGKGLKSLNQYGKIAHATMYREQNAPTFLQRMRHQHVVTNERYGTPNDKAKHMSEAIFVLRGVTEGTYLLHNFFYVVFTLL